MSSNVSDLKAEFSRPYYFQLNDYACVNNQTFDQVYQSAQLVHDKWKKESYNPTLDLVINALVIGIVLGIASAFSGLVITLGLGFTAIPLFLMAAGGLFVGVGFISGVACRYIFNTYHEKRRIEEQPFLFLDTVKEGNYRKAYLEFDRLIPNDKQAFSDVLNLVKINDSLNLFKKWAFVRCAEKSPSDLLSFGALVAIEKKAEVFDALSSAKKDIHFSDAFIKNYPELETAKNTLHKYPLNIDDILAFVGNNDCFFNDISEALTPSVKFKVELQNRPIVSTVEFILKKELGLQSKPSDEVTQYLKSVKVKSQKEEN